MTRVVWRPLIDGLLESVWLVDPADLRILAVNQAACALLGLERESLVGRPVMELAATPQDQFFWQDVIAGHSDAIHSETLLLSAEGVAIPVERRVSLAWPETDRSVYLVGLRDLRQQRSAENELDKLLGELRATLESTADGILATDLHGAIRNFNRHFAELWSLPHALQTQRDDASVYAHMTHQVRDAQRYQQRLQEIADNPLLETTDVLVLKSGRVLERVTRAQYSRGRPTGRVASFRDITQSLAAQSQLKLAARVFESSLEAIFVTDPQFLILSVNPACENLLQRPQDKLLGKTAQELFSDPQNSDFLPELDGALQQHGLWRGQLYVQRPGQSSCAVQMSWVLLRDDAGVVTHSIGFFRDLTDERAAQQRIEELAYSDALTGLPNRLLLSQRAEFALRVAERSGSECGVFFIDLDRFKNINDSMGHPFGDRVLIEVAQRLSACLRDTDTLCRLGGDEFVVFLQQIDARGAEVLAQRILAALEQTLTLDDMQFSIGCSIGVALYPGDGKTLDALIQCADTAMYLVKSRGRGSFRFYQPQMNVNLLSHLKMDHAMRLAMEKGVFKLHYQPQISLADGSLQGTEALIRWTDDELGAVSPAVFIPLAEESGFIITIGTWVLHEAVRQAALWQRQATPVTVSVNVSALQFQQPDFVATVAAALNGAALAPHLLELELTESILIQDANETLSRLHALAQLGVALSIDDFGTGYSSLAYLKRFPISKLKIDRSFVIGLPDDEGDCAIVSATIAMARALKLKVVAEGVETAAQRDYLASVGCDAFQGFLCSAALPADEFAKHMASLPGSSA